MCANPHNKQTLWLNIDLNISTLFGGRHLLRHPGIDAYDCYATLSMCLPNLPSKSPLHTPFDAHCCQTG